MSTPALWLLFMHQLPAQPSTHRVQVWRRLRSWGAINLHYSVWLLPDTPDLRQRLTTLCSEIGHGDATARLLPIQFPERHRDEEMKELFRKQSGRAYSELLLSCQALAAELRARRGAKLLDPLELTGLAEELARLDAHLEKIRLHEFFATGLHARAVAALRACRLALEQAHVAVHGPAVGTGAAKTRPLRRARDLP